MQQTACKPAGRSRTQHILCLQTAGMPVSQWEYNEDLRQACHLPSPPAEQWRVDLHEQSASKVQMGPTSPSWGLCNTHVHCLSHKALAVPPHDPEMSVVG